MRCTQNAEGTKSMKEKGHRFLAYQIYGAFVFSFFLLGGYFGWGTPKEAMMYLFIGVFLGLFLGVLWHRYLMTYMEDGFIDFGKMSKRVRWVAFIVALLVYYLMTTARYSLEIWWVLVIAGFVAHVYSLFGVLAHERKTGKTIRFAYERKHFLWLLLFAVAMVVVDIFFPHTSLPR